MRTLRNKLKEAYNAGYQCGLQPDSTGEENPFSIRRPEKDFHAQWNSGWIDGSLRYLSEKETTTQTQS